MPAANVRSIEALKDFRNDLVVLRERIRQALQSADADVARTDHWLKTENPAQLLRLGKRTQRQLDEALETLRRKRLSPTPTGEPASTTFEQRAVQKLKTRMEHLKEKNATTKQWQRRHEKSAFAYKSGSQHARRWAESGLAKTIGELDQLIAHLEKYQQVAAPPPMPEPPAAGSTSKTSD